MYQRTKSIVLPIGWVNPATPDAPPCRKLTIRLPTVSDEVRSQTKRNEMLRSSDAQAFEFASAPMSADVIFLAHLITHWEGVELHGWQHVNSLSRLDYNALTQAVSELEDEALATSRTADAEAAKRPL